VALDFRWQVRRRSKRDQRQADRRGGGRYGNLGLSLAGDLGWRHLRYLLGDVGGSGAA
jgi:hypothetical protein